MSDINSECSVVITDGNIGQLYKKTQAGVNQNYPLKSSKYHKTVMDSGESNADLMFIVKDYTVF